MAAKFPIEYDLRPTGLDEGQRRMTLALQNVGDDRLEELEAKLNSLDTYSISVSSPAEYVGSLEPGEEIQVPFQVLANATGRLYVSLDGQRDGEPFHWESPNIRVAVGLGSAELVSFSARTEPYPLIGQRVECEARVRSLTPTQNLVLEFWVETPTGDLESVAKEGLEALRAGDEVTRRFEMVPEQEGIYILRAYLYDGAVRIDQDVDYLSITR
jgi:hypothetical protein